MPKISKIKVVDIESNTLDAITETIETPIVDTVESNIVESVETHDTEEINILPKPKAKPRAKPKEPVETETEILNEVEEIKPKPKAKSMAKPKVDEFMDTEIEELPVKLKSKAKAKAKAQEEEPEIIDPVKLKAAEKVECPDCKRKVTQKSLTYSHKFTCIAAKSKAFQKEKESEPITTETVNNEVSEDTLDTRDFTHVDIVLPVKKPPPVSRLQMRQELKKERIKQLFVEAV